MQCPKCQSGNTAIAKMALLNNIRVGSGISTSLGTFSLRGPKMPQPDWMFYGVGAAIFGIGSYLLYLIGKEGVILWGLFYGIALIVLAWPFIFRSYRQKKVQAVRDHVTFLENNWLCSACGDIWPNT